MSVRMLAVAAVLLAGCGADTPDPVDPEVELGTGLDSFESLAPGADIFVIQGPQGGFHLLGSVSVRGLEPGNPNDLSDPHNPTTEFRVFSAGVRVDLRASTYVQGLDPAAAAQTYEMIGRLVILDIAADDELDGAEIVFEVTVTDVLGVSVSDQRTLIAIPHPANL